MDTTRTVGRKTKHIYYYQAAPPVFVVRDWHVRRHISGRPPLNPLDVVRDWHVRRHSSGRPPLNPLDVVRDWHARRLGMPTVSFIRYMYIYIYIRSKRPDTYTRHVHIDRQGHTRPTVASRFLPTLQCAAEWGNLAIATMATSGRADTMPGITCWLAKVIR